MAEKLLSDRALKAAKARSREYLLKDGGSLYARVRAAVDGSASVSWQYFFKWKGKTERLSIGTYPAVSLLEARRRREQARALLKADPPQHPVLEMRRRRTEAYAKARAEASEKSVCDLFEDWHSVYLVHHRKDGGTEARAVMALDVFPYIGAERARAVTRSHVSAIVDRILARGARRKANIVLALLKQMFAHGVVRGLVEADPTYGFTRRHAGGIERSRERVLSLEELAALARALPAAGLGEPQQAAVRLLLATGVRVGELNRALWADIDLAGSLWRIPKENTKNGREHLVHLAPFALAQIETLARFRGNDYLMPSRKTAAPIEDKALAKALRDRQREAPLRGRSKAHVGTLRLAGGDWSPHDLRRTFATRLAELQVLPHVIERALNHTMQGVMAVYNRNDYLPERRAALEAWSAQLEQIFAPPAANVLDMIPKLAARQRARSIRKAGRP